MSKRFKSQDYFRYKRLGKRWRKPKGLQSKLRLKKGGSGMRVARGYGKPSKAMPTLIRNMADFEKECSNGVIFSSTLGSKKTIVLTAKAKELGLAIANMKKVNRASKLQTQMKKKSLDKKEQEKKAKEEKAKAASGKKMGFQESVVPQVLKGKTKTYRIRDHGLKVGDRVALENSQSLEIFGRGKITHVEHTKVGKVDLKDPGHYKTYEKVEELIEAIKRHHPEKDITPETDVWVYTYEFSPADKKEKEKK